MSKRSKACSHTGHMHTMNKINANKENMNRITFETERNKIQLNTKKQGAAEHAKKGSCHAYPEDQSCQCACKK